MSENVDTSGLPTAQFAFPGPLRDRLVRLILEGRKTATTGLLIECDLGLEVFPVLGSLSVLVDSNDHPVAVLQCTGVQVVRLADVPMQHVLDEGEGHASLGAWRADHELFWRSAELRAELGDQTFDVDDDTRVVLERFAVVERC